MRKLILVLSLIVATAMADKPAKQYLPPGQAKKHPPAPPLPFPASTKLKAFSVDTPPPTSTPSDPTSPNYGVAYKFNSKSEDGKTIQGVYVQFNNWPSATPYVIQVSTDLVHWTDAMLSSGDDGRVVVIYDLDQRAFYRIQKAFVSGWVHPTPPSP